MLDLKTFRKIKELQKAGYTSLTIMRKVNISKTQYYKWGLLDEETFIKHIQSRSTFQLENYREYILSLVSTTPQINDTTVLYRCMEEFDEFCVPRMTFLRFVKRVREESGYVKNKRRIYALSDAPLPGLQAQVDFGQYKMLDMYGKNRIVYFFCMILTYSKMLYTYFSINPFTTEEAIKAHTFAFKYFGGRTQSILYDQTRLFLVSENFGDFILTEKFDEFVRKTGFSVEFCHKHDPMSKACVENSVWKVKHMFLDGREYSGVDSLNGACLEWLDRFANGDYHHVTKKMPKELFVEEYKKMTKVETWKVETTCILTVRRNNTLYYRGNNFSMPTTEDFTKMRVKVVEDKGVINVYRAATNEFITRFELPIGQGSVVSSHNNGKGDVSIHLLGINKFFGDDEIKNKYLEMSKRKLNPRYVLSQIRRLDRMTSYYTKEEILDAMQHCIEIDMCSVTELASYLIYKLGVDRARVYLHTMEMAHFTQRAKEIREEVEYGRH